MYLYLKDVVTLKIDAEKCTGCGFCLNVCPRGVIAVKDRKAFVAVKDACLECGACAKNCPAGAVTVKTGVGCATALLRWDGECPTCGCDGKKTSAGSSCCSSTPKKSCCGK